ncbi:MAG: malate dehydrogenase, partial [Chloroflexi bacterium]|nr:malate dehydrogenase [Chloroflexota bacterium]
MGAASAQRIVERGYAEVVLLDIVEGLAPGKALDILQSAPVLNAEIRLTGTSDYKDIADSELVIVTAGLFRKPGMTRDELLLANTKIVSGVIANIVKYSPQSIILMVSNPLDVTTYIAYQVLGARRERVMGMAGGLDTARFCTFIAWELGCAPTEVQAMVLGGHGDSMVPLP